MRHDTHDTRAPDARLLRRLLRWGAAVAGLGVCLAVFLWWVVIPNPRGLDTRNPTSTALMEQRIEEAREREQTLDVVHRWVGGANISPNLRRAVIVAEDYRFREHHGVDWVSLAEEVRWSGGERVTWTRPSDWKALAGAAAYAWSHRDEIRGRSTITQQLAKNLYFGTDRSFSRKAFELVVARRLERRLTKDRILELYLNVAEWGPGIFGAEAAAWHYFGHSAGDLTLPEAAALAGTLPHPLTSNPAYRPARMRWRQAMILGRLAPTPPVLDAPLPIPEPELELGIEMPEPVVAPLSPAPSPVDSGAIARRDTVGGH